MDHRAESGGGYADVLMIFAQDGTVDHAPACLISFAAHGLSEYRVMAYRG